MIDMPLEKLREYKGINPCPADIDAYWDKALDEMRGVDPKVEIIPAKDFVSPYADCFDLYFTGVGGARIYAKYLRPKGIPGPHPAVLEFHGYSSHSGEWSHKLPYVAAGFSVFAMDSRGQGGKSEDVGGVKGNTLRGQIIRGALDGPEKLLFRSIFLDAAELASIVMAMPEIDETRVGVMGTSQGGGMTLACAALEPRVRRIAPVYPFLSDYRRVWEMDLTKTAYFELTEYFRKFDPTHKRENEFFNTLGYIDVKNMVHRIKAEVLMFTGLLDDTCPPSTQFAAYNRIVAPKTIEIFPDFKHEPLPGKDDCTFMFLMGMWSL